MRFGNQTVPGSVFAVARNKMLELEQFTPQQMREHILKDAASELEALSSISINHRIIAERVMRECIAELRAAGQLASPKRGVWARCNAETQLAPAASASVRVASAPGR
jgi:hypothetical protein